MGWMVWDRRAKRRLWRLAASAICAAFLAGGVPSQLIKGSHMSAADAPAYGAPTLTNPGPRTDADRQGTYREAVLSDGPIAYWPLNDAAGPSVADAAGTTSVTRLGGIAAAQPGATGDGGGAMAFDGTGHLRAATHPALQLAGDLTLELWINVTLAGRQTLVSKASSGEFELTAEPAGFLNFFHGNGSTTEIIRSSGNVLQPNSWQHIVVTRSAATRQIAFFVNGVPRGGGPYAITPLATASTLVIGRSDGSGGSRYVNGRLDEVALYPAALDPAQVAAHHAARNLTGAPTVVSLQLQASDPDGQPLSFSAAGLPPSLAVNPATGLISGTLSATSAGVYPVTATTSDGALSTSQTFLWTITHTNRGPVLSNPGDRRDSDIYSYAQAILDDGPVAYWRLDDVGATAADTAGANTAALVGGVARSRAGVLADGHPAMGFDGATAYLRIVNAPSLQQNGDLTLELWMNVTLAGRQTLVSKASNGEFELTAEPGGFLNFFQGNGTTTEIIRSNFGVLVPNTWQHIVVTRTMATRQIAFFVNGVAKGGGTWVRDPVVTANRVVIGRSDGSSGSRYVNGRLDEVAIYPRALSLAQVAAHHALGSLAGSPTAVSLPLPAADADGDPLTFQVRGLPPSVAVNAATGLISGPLAAASPGVYVVTATASDGRLSNSQTFVWTIAHVNLPPSLGQPADQVAPENGAVALQLTASDPESKPLSYSATGLPAALAINPATGLISGTLSYSSAGVYQVTVTASDGALAASRAFTWTVLDTNRPPVLAAPGPVTTETAGYAESVLAAGPAAYWRLADAAGSPVQDMVGLNPGAPFGTLTAGQPGALADGNGAMSFDGATGYIRVPDSPSLKTTGDLTIELWMNVTLAGRQTLVSKAANGEFELTAEPSGFLNFFHGSGATTEIVHSSYGVLVPNTWQHVVVTRSAATRQILFYVNGVPRGGGAYQHDPAATAAPVVIGRSNGSGGTRHVKGRLDDVAVYPIAFGADRVAAHYGLRTRTAAGIPVTLQLAGSDPDSNTISYDAAGLPASLKINAATGLIWGTLAPADAGAYLVTAIASDGQLSASQTFTWTIRATAPVGTLSVTPDVAAPVVAGNSVTFTALATSGTAPHQFKWFQYSTTAGWTVLRDWAAVPSYTWTPAAADLGAHVTVWVRSAGNGSSVPEKYADLPFAVVPPPAQLTLPPGGDMSRALTWSPVPMAEAYRLWAGSSPGASDLLDSGDLQQTSYDASTLSDSNRPPAVAWDSAAAGLELSGYAIRLDGERTDLGPVPIATCTGSQMVACHRVELPPLANGGHTIEVSAYNAAGESVAAPVSIEEAARTVYVRLWTKVAGAWHYTDTTIMPASLAAQFLYPLAGAIHVDVTRPLSWSAVSGAEAYSLTIGSTAGAADLLNVPELHDTSYSTPALPPYQPLYVRLGTRVSGVWRYRDLTFSANPSAATLLYPANGGTIGDSAATFWWNPLAGATGYRLQVGTAPGGSSLVNSLEQSENYLAVPALPAGTPLHARLWTRLNGTWRYADSTLTAIVTPPTTGVPPEVTALRFVNPRNGETIAAGPLSVEWTPAPGAVGYRLRIGTTPGESDVAESADLMGATQYTVNVPAGTTLYVRVYWQAYSADLRNYVEITTRTRPVAPECPCSIWNTGPTPTHIEDTDPAAVTLGVRFKSDRGGYIRGIRFYKAAGNVGPHVGSLWTSDGTLLGSVTFTAETASGWQEATFAAPIPIAAGTTYVASYFTPSGHYAEENWYFDAPLDNSPLHVLSDGPGGSLYRYGSANAFPNQSYKASNYWVDVVFVDAPPAGGGQP